MSYRDGAPCFQSALFQTPSWFGWTLLLSLLHIIEKAHGGSCGGNDPSGKDNSDCWYELWYFWLIVGLFAIGAVLLVVVYCKQHAKTARNAELGRRLNHQMVLPPAPPGYNEPGHEPPPYDVVVTDYDQPPPSSPTPRDRTDSSGQAQHRASSVPPPYSPIHFLYNPSRTHYQVNAITSASPSSSHYGVPSLRSIVGPNRQTSPITRQSTPQGEFDCPDFNAEQSRQNGVSNSSASTCGINSQQPHYDSHRSQEVESQEYSANAQRASIAESSYSYTQHIPSTSGGTQTQVQRNAHTTAGIQSRQAPSTGQSTHSVRQGSNTGSRQQRNSLTDSVPSQTDSAPSRQSGLTALQKTLSQVHSVSNVRTNPGVGSEGSTSIATAHSYNLIPGAETQHTRAQNNHVTLNRNPATSRNVSTNVTSAHQKSLSVADRLSSGEGQGQSRRPGVSGQGNSSSSNNNNMSSNRPGRPAQASASTSIHNGRTTAKSQHEQDDKGTNAR
ncbi:homeobox protein prospero [Aplysia californica]|uniref:Homeobox protein prospero n=1 Tax=Aplysia californica TaxID=6500 RepID=A0ABM1AG38_APLCA|nr:homeobox protein prospero [Aplysia californica]